MELIIAIAVAALVVFSAYFLWKLAVIRRENDVKALEKHAFSVLFASFAAKRLEEICLPRFAACSSSGEAWGLYLDTRRLLPELALRAVNMAKNLFSQELEKRIEESLGDEQKLLVLIRGLPFEHPFIDKKEEIRLSLQEALRPFTEERIRKATTVRELTFLGGAIKFSAECYEEYPVDRIDEVLRPAYESKLRKLLLVEALRASQGADVNNHCFLFKCEDSDIDNLVAIKRSILSLRSKSSSPSFTFTKLLSEVDFALTRLLERENECSSAS